MSTDLAVARPRLCSFTFDDGRRCRIPHRTDHHLCHFHARKEAQRLASERAAATITYDLSGDYLAFRDINTAIANTISAIAYGHMKSKAATTIAYLCQSLVQSATLAESEHIRTFGEKDWRGEVVKSFNSRLGGPQSRPQIPPPPPAFDEADDEVQDDVPDNNQAGEQEAPEEGQVQSQDENVTNEENAEIADVAEQEYQAPEESLDEMSDGVQEDAEPEVSANEIAPVIQ